MPVNLEIRKRVLFGTTLCWVCFMVLFVPSIFYKDVLRSGKFLSRFAILSTEEGGYRVGKRGFHFFIEFIINPVNICKRHLNSSPGVLALVATAPENGLLRDAVRKTWGKELIAKTNASLVFVVGRLDDTKWVSAVKEEFLTYSDIIQADFVDTYDNLTLKTIAALQWAHTYCPKAKFIVKFDDDIFLNVPEFLKAIESRPRNAIYGELKATDKVIRDVLSKWFVSHEEYPEEFYPPFVSGSAYVVGGDVLKPLYQAVRLGRPLRLEDVYVTGICAQAAGIPRVRLDGIYSKKIQQPCEMSSLVTSHYVTVGEMFSLSKRLNESHAGC